jgi:hypothetical protein
MTMKSREELHAIIASSDDAYTPEARTAAAAELERRPANHAVTDDESVSQPSNTASLVGKIISFIVLMGALRSILRLVHQWLFK